MKTNVWFFLKQDCSWLQMRWCWYLHYDEPPDSVFIFKDCLVWIIIVQLCSDIFLFIKIKLSFLFLDFTITENFTGQPMLSLTLWHCLSWALCVTAAKPDRNYRSLQRNTLMEFSIENSQLWGGHSQEFGGGCHQIIYAENPWKQFRPVTAPVFQRYSTSS